MKSIKKMFIVLIIVLLYYSIIPTIRSVIAEVSLIFDIRISPYSETNPTIKWKTTTPADSQVEYGTDQSLGFSTALDTDLVIEHSVELSGLTSNTYYYYRVKSNGEMSEILELSTDLTVPTVNIIEPADKSEVSGIVNVRFSVNDNTGITLMGVIIEGEYQEIPISNTYAWDTNNHNDGEYMFSVMARDQAGNTGSADFTFKIKNLPPDITPPTVSIISPQDGASVYGKTKIIADVTDDQEVRFVEFFINGRDSGYAQRPPYEREWNTTLYTPGEYTIQAKAKDKTLNQGESEIITVTIIETPPDTTPPVTTDNYQYNSTWINEDANITLTATDDLSGVAHTYYTIDNGPDQEGTTIAINEEGQHLIAYWSVDGLGNTEASNTINVWIDKTAPDVTISADPNTLWPVNKKPVQVTINGLATDPLSGVSSKIFTVIDEYNEVTANLTDFGQAIELIPWRNGNDKDGRIYTINVVVTDNADNSTTKETTVIVPHDMSGKKK